jgi:hypothetical protein
MAITNHERIGKCLEQLSLGLQPFVERELKSNYQDNWFAETRKTLSATQVDFLGTADKPEWDIASLLSTLPCVGVHRTRQGSVGAGRLPNASSHQPEDDVEHRRQRAHR